MSIRYLFSVPTALMSKSARSASFSRMFSSGGLTWRPIAATTIQPPDPGRLEKHKLNFLFFCNSHNSLSQRLWAELTDRGHAVTVCEGPSAQTMVRMAAATQPDLIICPFLTKRIPQELYRDSKVPCLIVHPGIVGDRGMFSIDWALHNGAKEWGVTVLQADDEMDAGDISGTDTFHITREATKSSLYMSEITEAAVKSVLDAIDKYRLQIPPQPLRYDDPNVKGRLQKQMTKEIRTIDWSKTAEDAARTIRMSDTQPGAILKTLYGQSVLAYGAHIEHDNSLLEHPMFGDAAEPGDIVAQRHGAVLIKTADGKGVWVSHMKAKAGKSALKLPASHVLSKEILRNIPRAPDPVLQLPFGQTPKTFQEIWTTCQDSVTYVHFNFYNGAMDTDQCQRLATVLRHVAQDCTTKAVVLMGGHDYFSNGIHLNMIENAENPAAESWSNINAIDNVVKEIFTMKDKVTIAALQGNAGAGGAMMPLAADMVWTHSGVVINPHYKSMHLYGSEYWTYFLPQRVGNKKALDIVSEAKPMLVKEAVTNGMYDRLLGSNRTDFAAMVPEEAQRLVNSPLLSSILKEKKMRVTNDWLREVETNRHNELQVMQGNFSDPAYHDTRKKFVYH